MSRIFSSNKHSEVQNLKSENDSYGYGAQDLAHYKVASSQNMYHPQTNDKIQVTRSAFFFDESLRQVTRDLDFAQQKIEYLERIND